MTDTKILQDEKFGSRAYEEKTCYCQRCDTLLSSAYGEIIFDKYKNTFCSRTCLKKYKYDRRCEDR